MVLDTGCTHTVLHTKKAEKLGFKKSRRNKSTGMSTAAGVISSHSFSPLFFEALGMNIEDMPLEIADVDITNEYAGYLGLDFFKGKKFCIDLDNQIISLE